MTTKDLDTRRENKDLEGKQIRNACFTVNNYTQQEYDIFVELGENRDKCQYLIIAKEVGDSGTPHLQGYIEFTRKHSYMKFVTMTGRNFWARPRSGSQKEAKEYCQKTAEYREWGEPRRQGNVKESMRLETMVDAIEEGSRPSELVRSGVVDSTQKLAVMDKLINVLEKKRLHKTEVIYLYGETGTGKTRSAIKYFADILGKEEDDPTIFDDIFITSGSLKWFDGYQSHKYMIIDNFRHYHQQGNSILRLLDRYPYSLGGKGAHRQMLATHIIFTTCLDPITMFRNDQAKDNNELSQIMRRIDKSYLVVDNGVWINKTKVLNDTLKALMSND